MNCKLNINGIEVDGGVISVDFGKTDTCKSPMNITYPNAFSGTGTIEAKISPEFSKMCQKAVIVGHINAIVKMYNEAVIALKVTKKTHLKKALKAKIEILKKSYVWLNHKLNMLEEVA